MSTTSGVALSLTGSGHLLVYQLGACRILMKSAVRIQHVAGSSGGAIVATLLSQGFDLEEFSNDFISSRGNGLTLLKNRLESSPLMTRADLTSTPTLSICTTRCCNGELHMFQFNSKDVNHYRLLQAVEASCRIPGSFHPWDILSSTRSYSDSEGVLVDGDYYVDGGIAAPAPPVSTDMNRIVISPLTGPAKNCIRPSPSRAWSWWPTLQLRDNFAAQASVENLRALRAAMGMTTSSELNHWYQQGQDDASRFLEEFYKA